MDPRYKSPGANVDRDEESEFRDRLSGIGDAGIGDALRGLRERNQRVHGSSLRS